MQNKFSGKRFLAFLSCGIIVFVLVLTCIVKPRTSDYKNLLEGIALRPHGCKNTKQTQSNYQEIRSKRMDKKNLSFKKRIKHENPLFLLYRDQQAPPQKPEITPPTEKVLKKQKQVFFSSINPDLTKEKEFYGAIFRERQLVRPGKPLRIYLQEAIPKLKLNPGTVLKGIPCFSGNRIQIRITASIADNNPKKLDLVCFDKGDCLEGIYNDALEASLEEGLEDILIEEVLGTKAMEANSTRKIADLYKKGRSVFINSGTEIFVVVPEKTKPIK